MSRVRSITDVPETNLALSLDIESGRWNLLFRYILLLISAFVLTLILIASIAPVREVAIAEGQIVPMGSVVEVDHLEGGIVSEIAVREGQRVKKGATLVRLSPTVASADLEQLRLRSAHLRIQRVRLRALIQDTEPDFSAFVQDYPEQTDDQKTIFNAERAALRSEVEASRAIVQQKRSEFTATQHEIASLQSQQDIHQEQVEIRQRLLDKGFMSRRAVLETRVRLEQSRAAMAQATGRLRSARSAAEEAQSNLARSIAAKRSDWSDKLAAVTTELSELEQKIRQQSDRYSRLAIVAPTAGLIQEVVPKSRGEVIRPGEAVVKIVPSDETLVAEVRVKPEDIGHLSVGDTAEVKLSTFDSEVFGSLHAQVSKLSPTTFEDEQKNLYYKAILALDRTGLTHQGIEYSVQAGMVVRAEILTGAKSVMRYILKPVYRSLGRAFSER